MPSARKRSLLSQRVLDLLTHDWVDVEDLMERAIPMVPPGRAIRTFEHHRARLDADRERRIANGEKVIARKPMPSEAEQRRQGARSIVNAIIGDLRDNNVAEIEAGATRFDRRIRLSRERQFARHCCLHGGSCRGTKEDDDAPEAEDPLPLLIDRVLESRRSREEPRSIPGVREVIPGEIDRLLRECG